MIQISAKYAYNIIYVYVYGRTIYSVRFYLQRNRVRRSQTRRLTVWSQRRTLTTTARSTLKVKDALFLISSSYTRIQLYHIDIHNNVSQTHFNGPSPDSAWNNYISATFSKIIWKYMYRYINIIWSFQQTKQLNQ